MENTITNVKTGIIMAEPVVHKGENRIKLVFKYNPILIEKVKKIPGARWSQTMGCWHVSDNTESKVLLQQFEQLKTEPSNQEEKPVPFFKKKKEALIELDEYNQLIYVSFTFDLDLKKEIKKLTGSWWHTGALQWSVFYNDENLERLKELFYRKRYKVTIRKYQIEADRKTYSREPVSYERVPKEYIKELKLKNKSEHTITHYRSALAGFLEHFKDRNIKEISTSEIGEYILHYRFDLHYSPSFQNQVISALKIYYRTIHNRELDDEEIPRPKKSRQLPRVISKEEVEMMIKLNNNPKHKLIMMLMYGCGFRLGEVINLKKNDIDLRRNQINIYNGKGRKDRTINLTKKMSGYIEKFIRDYAPRIYLFRGQGNEQYSRESIGQIVKNSAYKAGIRKRVTPHVLRHCYATHMLEKGVDLRYIQYLMGHKSSKTTEIYTHISNHRIQDLGSPIDDIEI